MPEYNIQNLVRNEDRTEEERRINAQKAGIASGEARRKKKTMREMLDYLLAQDTTNDKGEKSTNLEVIMTSALKQAMKGDIKATTFIRDTIGEKPVEKQEIVATVSPKMAQEFEDLVDKVGR